MKLSQKLALGYIRARFKMLSLVSKRKAAAKAFELFCTPQSRTRKKMPAIFSEGEKLSFEQNGIKVRGWRFNHLAEKKVLIVHGYESSAINFDRYIRPLIKKGYEVLLFDAPAHGISGGKTITAPLYKQTILEIGKRYGPIRSYMAHSFGGLAVCLALEEISHTNDFKLVLIAPATETVSAINSFFQLLKLDPSLLPEFEKVIIRAGGVSSEWYSIKRAMKHIRAKIMWFHDEQDEVTPISDVLKVQAENHPNIQFVFTKGLGHRKIYRDNKVYKSVVDFL